MTNPILPRQNYKTTRLNKYIALIYNDLKSLHGTIGMKNQKIVIVLDKDWKRRNLEVCKFMQYPSFGTIKLKDVSDNFIFTTKETFKKDIEGYKIFDVVYVTEHLSIPDKEL